MEKLLVIDGNALIHRAFHAYPAFLTHNGVPTNALYGFAVLLQKAIQNFVPQYVIVCFDTPAPTFRKELLKTYQSLRPAPAVQLVGQFALVREFLNRSHITYIEKPGFEADDIIGTIVHCPETENINSFILTGDKDIMQLVNDHVFVITPRKGLEDIVIYNPEKIQERFGLQADQIPDLKALMGDASDNYSGVPGIGPKTATNLINQFGTIEKIYERLDEVENKKTKALLEKYKEECILSKKIATIVTDVDCNFNFLATKFESFHEDVKAFFEEMEFKSLTNKFFPHKTAAKPVKKEPPKESVDQIGLF